MLCFQNISTDQNDFIKNRKIDDNTRLMFAVTNYSNFKSIPEAVLSLNFIQCVLILYTGRLFLQC